MSHNISVRHFSKWQWAFGIYMHQPFTFCMMAIAGRQRRGLSPRTSAGHSPPFPIPHNKEGREGKEGGRTARRSVEQESVAEPWGFLWKPWRKIEHFWSIFIIGVALGNRNSGGRAAFSQFVSFFLSRVAEGKGTKGGKREPGFICVTVGEGQLRQQLHFRSS